VDIFGSEHSFFWWLVAHLDEAVGMGKTSFVWSGEAIVIQPWSRFANGFIACCMSWFNNTAYQANSTAQLDRKRRNQSLHFLVRDQRLGANVASAQGPTGLGNI
jgi:photosystem II CP43 chlorophyll apoprotein